MQAWLKKLSRTVKQAAMYGILILLVYEAVVMHVAGARNILLVLLWLLALVAMSMPTIKGVDSFIPNWLLKLLQWSLVAFLIWVGEWWLAIPWTITVVMLQVAKSAPAVKAGFKGWADAVDEL